MAFDYQRDDQKRRVRLIAYEPHSLNDLTEAIDRQLADNVWHYSMLMDLRRAILPREVHELVLERVLSLTQEHGPHGPVALITREAHDVTNAQLYAMKSQRLALPVEVFWDVESAEAWLDAQTNGA